MARTPLLRALRRLADEHRAAERLGIPPAELRGLREEALSRREFVQRAGLAGAAVVGGSAALAATAGAARGAGNPSVAIVGAGIAGLTAALTLADKGIASTVYEASPDRIGGRMHSDTSGYWDAGQVSEFCGELIDTGHMTIRHLVQRFGLPAVDLIAAQPNRSTDTLWFLNGYYSVDDADSDFQPIHKTLQDQVQATSYPTTYRIHTDAGIFFDQMTIYDWIETYVPGGHGSRMGRLLDAAYNIEYGAETTVQSSLNLLYLLGFQPTKTQLDLFGESDERFHIRGGNQRLPEAIADELGDAVVTGHKLVRLAQTPNGRYCCTFERGGTTIEVITDLVVLAIPFAVLANVDIQNAGFSALKLHAINDLGRAHNGKLNLQFERRGWLGPGPWPGLTTGTTYSDTGYQASWEVTRAQPGTPGIIVLYSGGNVTDAMRSTSPFATASDPKVLQDVRSGLAQLDPVFPNLAWNGLATESLPHKSPFFGASYSFWKIGQYTDFGGFEGVPQGGAFFCGEHTSQDFQGFMEGGASTGKATAEDLIKLFR